MRIAPFLAITLIVFSCDDPEPSLPACGVANPVERLPWLKAEIKSYDQRYDLNEGINGGDLYISIMAGTYQGNEVIIVIPDCCYPITCPELQPFKVKNCNGEIIGHIAREINWDDVKNKRTIWSYGRCKAS